MNDNNDNMVCFETESTSRNIHHSTLSIDNVMNEEPQQVPVYRARGDDKYESTCKRRKFEGGLTSKINGVERRVPFNTPVEGTPVVTKVVKRAGPYLLGPTLGSSPVKSIVQCLARKESTDQFYTLKILTLKDLDEECKDDRQGKMLLHTEFSLLSLLHNQEGVIHHHSFFKDCALEEQRTSSGQLVYTGRVKQRLCLVLDCLWPHDFSCRNSDLLNLQHHVIREKKLGEREAIVVFYNAVRVVHCLHKNCSKWKRMSDKELDFQYSPRRWTKRLHPDVVVQEHIRVTTQATQAAKENVPCSANVRYGPKTGQTLDIYGGETLPRDAPIFVYVHGGYWQELNKDMCGYSVQPLHAAGIRVVVVGYDLTPAVTVQEIVEEITEAARYVINLASDYGSKCVWFCGHCVGAHLTSLLLSTAWYQQLEDEKRSIIRGFCHISGVFDVTPLIRTHINEAVHLTSEDAEQLSPMLIPEPCKKQENLRMLLVLAQYDSPEFHRQTKEYANKLRSQNYEVEELIIPEVDHFNIVENLQLRDFELIQVITKSMK